MKDIIVLGVETSCDETSCAVVKNGRIELSNIISSQIDIHKKYGGVVPEIASRKHVELILPVIDQALAEADIDFDDIDVIAVTYGPGLVGALLIGVCAAKALAYSLNKPLIGVHHLEGHIAANYIQFKDLEPPFVCLIASGGHSHIVITSEYIKFKIIGQTRDDSAGEAFDKVARTLGLGYPGGPLIDEISAKGNSKLIEFPRVYFKDGSYDFSFSGIKTAVLNYINTAEQRNELYRVEDVAACFQEAVVEVLVSNTIKAAQEFNMDKIVLAGGVAANSLLRAEIKKNATKEGFEVFYPKTELCTDNAAMIASAAYFEYENGKKSDMNLDVVPKLKLGET